MQHSVDKAIQVAAWIIALRKGTISVSEQEQLNQWLAEHPDNRSLFAELTNGEPLQAAISSFQHTNTKAAAQRIAHRLHLDEHPAARTLHLFRSSWLKYAAAALICIGMAAYFFSGSRQEAGPRLAEHIPVVHSHDIPPGTTRAMLTLADGSRIALDSSGISVLAVVGNTTIRNEKGKLVYTRQGSAVQASIQWNTMSTPRGGQYQLKLPDGTMVWLNAASSISYPTAFEGNIRKVSITGEAYFEIARNAQSPFVVSVGDGSSVEVLGTHFNINAYGDNNAVNTTLLEGSVRLHAGSSMKMLTPGQQGQVRTNGRIDLNEQVNVDQVMAWKYGFFDFENIELRDVMRQLSRWYDVEVEYGPGITPITFGGQLGRNVPLSKVLEFLKRSGVHFLLEKNKLMITK